MTKYFVETKLKAVKLVQAGYSIWAVANRMHLGSSILIDNWLSLYKKYGKQTLQIKFRRFAYIGEFNLISIHLKFAYCYILTANFRYYRIFYRSLRYIKIYN